MLTVLAYYHGDQDQAQRLSEWIAELGGVSAHKILVVLCHRATEEGVVPILRQAFASVEVTHAHHKDEGWPQSPNLAFDCAARYVQEKIKEPWFWIEPDAIPLVPEWLDKIHAEYNLHRKRFMGAYVKVGDTIPHMSGVAVYPFNMALYAPRALNCFNTAWDVVGAEQVIPQMHATNLIQHQWKSSTFHNAESLDRFHAEAVVYHQSKDGSLIARLRERKNPPPVLLSDIPNHDEVGALAVMDGKFVVLPLEETYADVVGFSEPKTYALPTRRKVVKIIARPRRGRAREYNSVAECARGLKCPTATIYSAITSTPKRPAPMRVKGFTFDVEFSQ